MSFIDSRIGTMVCDHNIPAVKKKTTPALTELKAPL